MRIMDGLSKKQNKSHHKKNPQQLYTMDLDEDNPEDPQKMKRKKNDQRQQEEKLRQYEEMVFLENVVESSSILKNKK